MRSARRIYLCSMLVLVTGLVLSGLASAKEEKKEKTKPIAVYSMAILPPADSDDITPSEVWVEINRYTTPEEKASLLALIKDKGQNAALNAAQNNPVGWLRRSAGLSTKILYAFKDEGSDRVVIATLRFDVFPDAAENVDPMLSPFTLATFTPTADGKGKGKIYGACALHFDKDGKLDETAFPASTAELGFVKMKS
jgi:hypothetical protein